MLPLVALGAHASRLPALTCSESYRTDAYLKTLTQKIPVEVTKSPAEQARGLGGRQCIGVNRGMLFEFDKPGNLAFWMKDMRFNIDIVWLDSSWRVVSVKPNISPRTYPQTFTSSRPAQYVLELAAGQAGCFNLTPGSITILQP